MNKDIKALVPELRFPGFEENWENKTLGNICSITNGKANAQDHIDGGKYPLFDRSEIIKASNEYLFDTETVIIPGEGMRFVPKYFKGRFNLHQRAYALMNFKYNGEFICYSLSNQSNLLAKKAVQSTVLSLRLPILQNFPLAVSENFKEQQKIADCLSSLDTIIDEHSKRLELLREHKKGLMQQLFPQEGEKVPRLRFPEFERDGEWTIKTLKELTEKIGDGIHTTPKYDILGDFYFINGNNLIDGKIIVDEKTKKISYKEFEIHKKDLTNDTLLISINGTIGNLAFYHNEKIVLGKSACYITPKNTLNSKFLYYYLDTPIIKTYFSTELTGSTIKNLSLKSIRNALIKHPNLFEQQKIADCLSNLDNLIEADERRIEQLQLHKKGLMQKLFPVMND